jgi:hypothetical protein
VQQIKHPKNQPGSFLSGARGWENQIQGQVDFNTDGRDVVDAEKGHFLPSILAQVELGLMRITVSGLYPKQKQMGFLQSQISPWNLLSLS